MTDTTSFTPAEAARISGVNVALQRDWRRRGILPPIEGKAASFDPIAVASMMALNALAERGLGPLNYKGIASKLGAMILRRALLERSAYQGPADQYLPASLSGPELEWIRRAHPTDRAEYIWQWRATCLANGILNRSGHANAQFGRFFIQWADGAFDFYSSIEEQFAALDPGDIRLTGAIIVLDLSSMGMLFAKRSGPIATVDEELIAIQRGLAGCQRMQATLDEILGGD